MTKQIQFNQTGNSSVLNIVETTVPAPQPNEVQIEFHALGLNRAEIMYRNGQYVIEPQSPCQIRL